MLAWPVLLGLLKSYWYIGVFIVMGAIIGIQHLEINHLTVVAEDAKTELATYRQNAENNYKAWASSNASLTLKVKELSNNLLVQLSKKNMTLTSQRKVIENDPVARSIIVPPNVVQLFNESASDPTSQGPPPTIGTNEAATNLAVFASVCSSNAEEQVVLVKQVLEWQSFWSEYVKGVQSVNTE